jgi:hypothetical protein
LEGDADTAILEWSWRRRSEEMRRSEETRQVRRPSIPYYHHHHHPHHHHHYLRVLESMVSSEGQALHIHTYALHLESVSYTDEKFFPFRIVS